MLWPKNDTFTHISIIASINLVFKNSHYMSRVLFLNQAMKPLVNILQLHELSDSLLKNKKKTCFYCKRKHQPLHPFSTSFFAPRGWKTKPFAYLMQLIFPNNNMRSEINKFGNVMSRLVCVKLIELFGYLSNIDPYNDLLALCPNDHPHILYNIFIVLYYLLTLRLFPEDWCGYFYLVYNAWYLVLDTWYIMLGTWYLIQSIRYLVPDMVLVWYWYGMVLGNWYLVTGTWYLVSGTWYLMFGIWHLVTDTW